MSRETGQELLCLPIFRTSSLREQGCSANLVHDISNRALKVDGRW